MHAAVGMGIIVLMCGCDMPPPVVLPDAITQPRAALLVGVVIFLSNTVHPLGSRSLASVELALGGVLGTFAFRHLRPDAFMLLPREAIGRARRNRTSSDPCGTPTPINPSRRKDRSNAHDHRDGTAPSRRTLRTGRAFATADNVGQSRPHAHPPPRPLVEDLPPHPRRDGRPPPNPPSLQQWDLGTHVTRPDCHEGDSYGFDRVISITTEEARIACRPYGSTTWKSDDAEKGLEADECYYFTADKMAVAAAAARRQSNSSSDYPFPDLAIEVDMRRPAVDRAEIYADPRRARGLELR